MERPVRLIVKAKVDPVAQFLPKKIKGRRLSNSKVVSSQNTDLRSSNNSSFQVIQDHPHTRFHEERNDQVYSFSGLHTDLQLIVKISPLIIPAGRDICKRIMRFLFMCIQIE